MAIIIKFKRSNKIGHTLFRECALKIIIEGDLQGQKRKANNRIHVQSYLERYGKMDTKNQRN